MKELAYLAIFFTYVKAPCKRWMFLYFPPLQHVSQESVCLGEVQNVFVDCNKPHEVGHDCKTLNVFQFCLGWLYCLSVIGKKAVTQQIQRCKTQWRSVMREYAAYYCVFRTLAHYFPFRLPFLPLSLVSVSFSVSAAPTKLAARSKGREGRLRAWSIKLVNHFLFSLRTAVDWWERPLCPPSQPASKFAASPLQCRTASCRRGRGRNSFASSMLTA